MDSIDSGTGDHSDGMVACPRPGISGAMHRRGPSVRPCRGRTLFILMAACLGSGVMAKDRPAPPPPPCVAVDIGGQRAGHLDCAARRLEDAARIARVKADAAKGVPVPQAGSADVRVGVSSLSGTRLRMGGNLGRSVHPSRPVVTPAGPSRPR